MGLLSRIGAAFSRPSPSVKSRPERRAGYDAAKTTDENRNHWAEADDLTANAELTPEVRRKLRMRSRYEVKNNCFASGLVRTLVADTVGTGPRLQMMTADKSLNEAVEAEWKQWCLATNFALNIRVLAGTQVVAGECFGVFRESKRLDRLGLPVTLDLRLIEPDQVCDPDADYLMKKTGDDGIVCDADGEIVAYKILKAPPNDQRFFQQNWDYDTVGVDNVIHYFQPNRPGQLRAATPLVAALPLFAQLRRFTLATLTAAEMAAMLAGVMHIDGSPGEVAEDYDSMDTVKMVRGMLLSLPVNAKATQFKPEQPTTNYEMFVNAKLREIGRCLDMPFEKVSGDYSRTNYSSGKLSDRMYWGGRNIDRQMIELQAVRPTFYKFCDLLRFAIPALAAFKGRPWELKHCWHYDGQPAIEPVKEASGDEINLTNGSDTLASIAMRDGTTVEELLDQRQREMEMFKERGLPLPAWMIGTAAPVRSDTGEPVETQKAVAA